MQRLLLGGLIASLGLWTLPTQAQQVTNTQVGALVEALRQAAPKTGKENDGLYSEWQLTPGIIPSWSRQCVGRELTPTQLETSPVTARSMVTCIMRRELQKQYRDSNNETVAVSRAACWWMTGNATKCNSGSTAAYTQKILGIYQQERLKPMVQPAVKLHQPSSSPQQPK